MQLRALALALLAAAAPASADPVATIDARTAVYQDSDHTFVSTTTAAARGTIGNRFTLEARYLADVITSASVDVVSAATTAFHEVRNEAEAGAGYRDGTSTVDLSYVYSVENDWESHTGSLGLSRDLLQHNLTVAVGGTFVYNDVGRAGDPNFHKRLLIGGGTASLTGTPSPRDLVQLSYTFAFHQGYQASPYRFVLIPTGPSRIALPESDPDTRLRHAVTLRLSHACFRESALHLSTRVYGDDWGVLSLTAEVEYLIGLGDFTLGLHARGYAQTGASFYQSTYSRPAEFVTADRELSPFLDGFGGARLVFRRAIGRLDELRVEARIDGFGFHFFDFPRLPERDGLIAELAVGVSL